MGEVCATCRHWRRPSERVGFGNVVHFWAEDSSRAEARARSDRDDMLFGSCTAINLGVDLPFDGPTPLAVTKDASEYVADLFTQAEFGCVMHEPAAQPGDGGDAAAGES